MVAMPCEYMLPPGSFKAPPCGPMRMWLTRNFKPLLIVALYFLLSLCVCPLPRNGSRARPVAALRASASLPGVAALAAAGRASGMVEAPTAVGHLVVGQPFQRVGDAFLAGLVAPSFLTSSIFPDMPRSAIRVAVDSRHQ